MSGETALKLALKARTAREEHLAALSADPIAIIGQGCRLPGSVHNPEDFWKLLSDGRDGMRRVPIERWDADSVYDPDPSAPGKSITRTAGFLDRIDTFDAHYFGILPREAEQMDPQQRLFLEVAIEALDDAGQPQDRIQGGRTGVYVASYHNDYAKLIYDDPDAIDLRTLTGTLHSVLANRLSWLLDLRGPSLTLDTACSSSLVAIHLACQSLRFGETDMAIAGGVSLMVTPDLMISMSKVGFMSPAGHCRTFDASADGFGRGEGCGVIVLKRLSDALADGDRVLAVIRSTVVNQDGRSTVLAAPSGPAQEALIREALDKGHIEPGRIGFVEAHGTGTALGDPIEVEALAATIGRMKATASPCLLGSAKANIGHLEAAAGVTGLIKAVLALRHEAIPPQANFSSLNPHIKLVGTRLSVPTTLVPWPAGSVPRAAAVSSFGVGGTNAHAIVEEAPRLPPSSGPISGADCPRLLPISAKSPAALRDLCDAWARFIATDDSSLADLCWSAGERRTHYPERKAIVASDRAAFERALREAGTQVGAAAVSGQPRVGFVFCGQGPQWYAMGRQLLVAEDVFREALKRCDEALRPHSGFSLIEELGRTEHDTRLGSTIVAQPALFGLQVALCSQLAHWGIKPDAVLGHSVGEIAAIHVAGVLDLEEATRIVWHRARLMQSATGLGCMASVSLPASATKQLLRRHPDLDIAAFNAPTSVVLAGTSAALDAALLELDKRGVAHRRLPVDYAFHSAQMEPSAIALVRELSQLRCHSPVADIYSSVTGGRLAANEVNSDYFGRNVREPVRFAEATAALLADGCNIMLEIGPHPVLHSSIDEIAVAAAVSPRVLATMRRGRDERTVLLGAVAGAYEGGCNPDWAALSNGEGSVVSLPSYPWQRSRYWIAQRRPRPSTHSDPALHPLLGRAVVPEGDQRHAFEGSSREVGAWLGQHRLFGKAILPAAAVMEAFCKAAALIGGRGAVGLANFAMDRPVVVRDEEEVRWRVVYQAPTGGVSRLTFHVEDDAGSSGWQVVAHADVVDDPPHAPALAPLATALPCSGDELYAFFERHGAEFGPQFRLLREFQRGPGWASARITPTGDGNSGFLLLPAVLDAGLQLCSAAASPLKTVYLPVGAERIQLAQWRGEPLFATARARLRGAVLSGDISITTASGATIARIEGLSFVQADPAALGAGARDRCDSYVEDWVDAPDLLPVSPVNGAWLVFDDAASVCSRALTSVSPNSELVRVRPGSQLRQRGPREWEIDPVTLSDMHALFECRVWGDAPLRGIVHGWSLGDQSLTSDLESRQQLALASLLHLIQAARRHPAPLRVVTRSDHALTHEMKTETLPVMSAGASALAQVAALEEPDLRVRVIEVSSEKLDSHVLARELVTDDPGRIRLHGTRRLSPRLHRLAVKSNKPQKPVQLVAAYPGDFSGLDLAPLQRPDLARDEVRIKVHAAGLNFRDVLATLDLYPGSAPPLGAECAGEVIECGDGVTTHSVGDQVFGYAPGSLASEVVVPAAFVAQVPAELDDDRAATFTVAFATALYGLERLAGLQRGERVLVHSAAGGVGMAAVQLALAKGAIVHATVSSPAKRDQLRAMGVDHIHNSRSMDFVDEILTATGGRGVDVVLNSLSGAFVAASFQCLARGGRFLEIGKRDVWSPERVVAERPDAAYHLYDLGSDAERSRPLIGELLGTLCQRLAEGLVRPLPVETFPLDRVADAMRTMAQARHIGKIAIQVSARRQSFRAWPDASYWITGGLGALGLETADWLCRSGARHLVLSGRSAPGDAARSRIQSWRDGGIDVRVETCDVSDAGSVQAVLDRIARTMPPLRGLVHAAGVLRDGVLSNQTWAEAKRVLEPKVHGALILDRLTRDLPLEFFILYSAGSVALGGAGQGLYTAANAELDALARHRSQCGLSALSVAWGPWTGLGMASQGADAAWADRGVFGLTPATAFAELERLLASRAPYGVILAIDWARFLSRAPSGLDLSYFTAVSRQTAARPQKIGNEEERASPLQAIRSALPAQRREKLSDFLRERSAQILGLDKTVAIDARRPLKEYGIDSLMSVELRNLLARAGGVSLPVTVLFDYPTLEALTCYFMTAWGLVEEQTVSAAPTSPNSAAAEIATLSDDEVERLLRHELANVGGRT